jgi:hypothetical protein
MTASRGMRYVIAIIPLFPLLTDPHPIRQSVLSISIAACYNWQTAAIAWLVIKTLLDRPDLSLLPLSVRRVLMGIGYIASNAVTLRQIILRILPIIPHSG